MTEELKPCPFCGGGVTLTVHQVDWYEETAIDCAACNVQLVDESVYVEPDSRLIGIWNKRVSDD
jgi:hypothetical protein